MMYCVLERLQIKISLKKFVILSISNIQQMGKFLPFWLILPTLLHLITAENLLLDPPFPPTAFLNQKYSIKFQVSGLVRPTFSFFGLPSFLIGYSNGSLIGTPQSVGSFKVNVSYSDKTRKGYDEVVICIQSNTTDNTNLDANEQSLKGNLYIDASSNSWIFRAGGPIDIQFNFINAVDPIAVSYKNLPPGLTGENTTLSGSITEIGIYTFSVTIGDSNGFRDQAYFAINIQPNQTKLTNTSSIRIANQTADVPVKNVQYSINLNVLELTQSTTKNTAKNAFSKLIDATNNVIAMKNAVYNSENVLTLAQQSQVSVQQSYQNTQQNINSIQNYLNDVSSAIASIKMQISLITTALSQNNATVKQAKDRLKVAEAILANTSKMLNQSASTTETAIKDLQVTTNVSVNNANAIRARNAFNESATNVEIMKDNLSKAQRQLDNAKLIIAQAQLNVELATSDNDVATTNLKLANSNIKIASDNIQSINSYLESTKKIFEDAKTSLGVSKFKLVLAQNRLFIAQAAKGAADKALAILVSQGNVKLTQSKQGYEFKGCDSYAYPSIFGSAHATELIANGLKTTGGHILIWGVCTQKPTLLKVGDLIYYEGSLIKDYISVKLIKKLSK